MNLRELHSSEQYCLDRQPSQGSNLPPMVLDYFTSFSDAHGWAWRMVQYKRR